jgi:hypothetical protein
MELPMLAQIFDRIADVLAIEGLERNTKPVRWSSLPSLGLLFAPGGLFLAALALLRDAHPRFTWLHALATFPWQLWAMLGFGTVATLGGVGDWIFHKIYVTVGPKEHHSHMLALGAGGVVFILMAMASISARPAQLLLPVIVGLLATVILICYDEFAFHIRRCKPFETMLHRLLVFGNGLTLLCWMHWAFVADGARG